MMNSVLQALGLLVLVAVGVHGVIIEATWKPQPSASSAFPPMWPLPKYFTNGTEKVVVVGSELKLLQTGSKNSSLLEESFSRFLRRAFPHRVSAMKNAVKEVKIGVDNVTAPVNLDMNESYVLEISTSGIAIRAPQLYGAYHALETLSQLVQFDFGAQEFNVMHAPWRINDAPRFAHRGLLIDSARHFLPVPTIKAIVDSATYAKLNTIHWHIVDSQSFPFDSPTYPKLAEMGAYSKYERFTPNDVADVVEHARRRGIRVEVELDTPGHSAAMCPGMPEICPSPWCKTSEHTDWALDPTKNITYEVVGNLLKDLSALFPEKVTHLGGDEVDTECWSKHPEIMHWLKERNMTLDGAFMYYFNRVSNIAWSMGREVVGWQEIWDHFGTKLNPKTIVQQWLPNSIKLPLNVTSHGYRLIWSDSSVWYLDQLEITWDKMYEAEPCNGLPDKSCELVIGGEGCQWGETVDTSDAMQTIWPRLGAIAERLWSPRTYNNASAAHDRMEAFRCLLNERGVEAAPVNNLLARSPPPHPGSCFRQ